MDAGNRVVVLGTYAGTHRGRASEYVLSLHMVEFEGRSSGALSAIHRYEAVCVCRYILICSRFLVLNRTLYFEFFCENFEDSYVFSEKYNP